jgi:hypothetical protein
VRSGRQRWGEAFFISSRERLFRLAPGPHHAPHAAASCSLHHAHSKIHRPGLCWPQRASCFALLHCCTHCFASCTRLLTRTKSPFQVSILYVEFICSTGGKVLVLTRFHAPVRLPLSKKGSKGSIYRFPKRNTCILNAQIYLSPSVNPSSSSPKTGLPLITPAQLKPWGRRAGFHSLAKGLHSDPDQLQHNAASRASSGCYTLFASICSAHSARSSSDPWTTAPAE